MTTFVASDSASSGMGVFVVTVPKPAWTLEGHTMIANIAVVTTSNAVAVNSVPTGWTQITRSRGRIMYYKVAGASEPTGYTWDLTDISVGWASAPVLGIICTYDSFGTDGLDSGQDALWGFGSIGIPGFSGGSFITQLFGTFGHAPPTVMNSRFPVQVQSFDEERGSLTPPLNSCNHATLRETVTEAGFWVGLGANCAWSLNAFDILDSKVLRQVEYQAAVTIGTNSSTSSGNTTVGTIRNGETTGITEFGPRIVTGRIKVRQRWKATHLPYDLNRSMIRELRG